MTGPVDASVNATVSGIVPDVRVPMRPAVTGSGGTGVVMVVVVGVGAAYVGVPMNADARVYAPPPAV
jgi:hypothetical protein